MIIEIRNPFKKKTFEQIKEDWETYDECVRGMSSLSDGVFNKWVKLKKDYLRAKRELSEPMEDNIVKLKSNKL